MAIIKQFKFGVKVLGSVQAGFPSPAEEELIDILSLDEFLIPNPRSTYLLRVKGDSMISTGIHPDDFLLVERGRNARNGDIIVLQIGNGWTLKCFLKNTEESGPGGSLRRKSESFIKGVVIASFRKYASA